MGCLGAVLSSDDEISQVIPTVAGQTYQVNFKLGFNDPAGPQDFRVTLGPTTLFSEVNDTTGSMPCNGPFDTLHTVNAAQHQCCGYGCERDTRILWTE